MGTAPSGFVRQGTQEAQVTLTLRQGHVRGLVSTGRHRFTADARYISARHQFQLTVRTAHQRSRSCAASSRVALRWIGRRLVERASGCMLW